MSVADSLKLLLFTGKDVYIQEDDRKVELRSIGDTVSVSVSIPGRAGGSLMINRDKFSSLVAAVPGYDKISISRSMISLSTDVSKRTFIAQPSANFPEITTDNNPLSQEDVDVGILYSAINTASMFVKRGEDNYFTGYVHVSGGRVFGSDKYSMFAAPSGVSASLIIHPSQVKAVGAFASVMPNAKLSNFSTHWTLSGENCLLRLSKPSLGDQIPSFDLLLDRTGIISRELKIKSGNISLDFNELKSAMSSCLSIFVAEEYAYALISSDGDGIARIYAKSDAGGGDEFISNMQCSPCKFRVKANPRLVERAIANVRRCKFMAVDCRDNLYFSSDGEAISLVAPMLEQKKPDFNNEV